MSVTRVVPRLRIDGGWAVVRDGAVRASGVYESRKDALTRGKEIAKADKGKLFVHDEKKPDMVVERFDFSKK
jgi:hypothetical protein